MVCFVVLVALLVIFFTISVSPMDALLELNT